MSRLATLVLFVLAAVAVIVPLMWVAFRDGGVPRPGRRGTPRSRRRVVGDALAAAAFWTLACVALVVVVCLVNALFPLREGEAPVSW